MDTSRSGEHSRIRVRRLAMTIRCTNGERTRDTAMQFPVASMTTSSVGKRLAEPLKSCSCHVDAATPAEPAVFPENHLAKRSVDINSDNPSHKRHLSFEQRKLRATRQLRIRALGATGRRRGGQLLTRAHSSSKVSACRHLRAPGASVPDARSIRRNSQNCSRTSPPQVLYRLPTRVSD